MMLLLPFITFFSFFFLLSVSIAWWNLHLYWLSEMLQPTLHTCVPLMITTQRFHEPDEALVRVNKRSLTMCLRCWYIHLCVLVRFLFWYPVKLNMNSVKVCFVCELCVSAMKDPECSGDVLSSPEYPISGSGAGPSPSELTAWTLISNGVYVPVLFTKNGGDWTSALFQCMFVPPASRHHTLYMKPWPLWKRLSISCKDTREYKMNWD